MNNTLFLVGRWFLVGALIGTVSAIPWVLIVLWLDHTESGQTVCYTRAIEINRAHFEQGDRKVSIQEGARISRPDVVGKSLVIPLVVLLIALPQVTKYLYEEKKTDPPPVASEGSDRQWRIAYVSSIAGAVAVLIIAVLWLG